MIKVSEVKSQIDTHEAVCAERWRETLSRLRRLEQILLGTTATMLAMMAGLLLR
jgi:predicted nucleic acid-binding Zn ribbon protein